MVSRALAFRLYPGEIPAWDFTFVLFNYTNCSRKGETRKRGLSRFLLVEPHQRRQWDGDAGIRGWGSPVCRVSPTGA